MNMVCQLLPPCDFYPVCGNQGYFCGVTGAVVHPGLAADLFEVERRHGSQFRFRLAIAFIERLLAFPLYRMFGARALT